MKIRIFQSAKCELMRNTWDTFVDEPPSVAQDGRRCVSAHRREHFLLRIDSFFADEKAS